MAQTSSRFPITGGGPVQVAEAPARVLYFDALRALACFLVIVNHTNSLAFQALAPDGLTWYLSILWYYASKVAVPLFVMVAGACLLPKRDTYRRTLGRILRLVAALVLFSYFYYLWQVWLTHWTWQRALDIPGFLASIWQERITDAFWYLYFYIGFMVMLPLLQRMAGAMEGKDYRYLVGLSIGLNAAWPLLCHYLPAAALPKYLDMPLFSSFIGLFFAGHYLHAFARPRPWHKGAALGVALAGLALATGLTRWEYARVPLGAKYWFMDERTAPALPVIASALAGFYLARLVAEERHSQGRALPLWGRRAIVSLGRWAFPVYLLQDWVVAETRQRVFEPLCIVMDPFLAALVWTLLAFILCLAPAWALSRVPGLRRIV